jgi:hypothetical protein
LGNLVHIYTDHKRLKYLFTQPDLNMRQRRWLELIKNYEFEVSLSSWKGECGVRCPKPQALTRAFPPSPLPLRIGFKTGASPSSPPAPFLLLEHDSSATYPLPSPSPSPPTVSSTRVPLSPRPDGPSPTSFPPVAAGPCRRPPGHQALPSPRNVDEPPAFFPLAVDSLPG